MAATISAEQVPEEIAEGLREAASDLQVIKSDNEDMRQRFESEGWSGLDRLAVAGDRIDQAYDSLLTLAEKFGLAAEVRAAYLANTMVGNKRTVTEQTTS
jgi:hypothetical protein